MKDLLRAMRRQIGMARMKRDVRRGVPVRFGFRDGIYWLNPDSSAIYHIVHSTPKIAAMADLIPADAQIVFDVGANCGLFAAFAQRRATQASIHCFEPSASLLPLIRRNLAALPGSVQVNGVAVGDRAGPIQLYVNPQSEQTNSLNKDAVGLFVAADRIRSATVDCITLDDYAEAQGISAVDVLKVDVQGFEGAVFRGASGLLPSVGLLFVESTWMDVESITELLPFAKHYGFTHASVINPVHMGADILLSRRPIASPAIKLHFALGDGLDGLRWW